jgi:hypothetical protein
MRILDASLGYCGGRKVMGMREKMIELLKEAMVLSDGICRIVGNTQAVAIGHYLFANGVTIPVRCKDCKWVYRDKYSGVYFCHERQVRSEHFCSYGERRTDG